jgi:hypothetical protein
VSVTSETNITNLVPVFRSATLATRASSAARSSRTWPTWFLCAPASTAPSLSPTTRSSRACPNDCIACGTCATVHRILARPRSATAARARGSIALLTVRSCKMAWTSPPRVRSLSTDSRAATFSTIMFHTCDGRTGSISSSTKLTENDGNSKKQHKPTKRRRFRRKCA